MSSLTGSADTDSIDWRTIPNASDHVPWHKNKGALKLNLSVLPSFDQHVVCPPAHALSPSASASCRSSSAAWSSMATTCVFRLVCLAWPQADVVLSLSPSRARSSRGFRLSTFGTSILATRACPRSVSSMPRASCRASLPARSSTTSTTRLAGAGASAVRSRFNRLDQGGALADLRYS